VATDEASATGLEMAVYAEVAASVIEVLRAEVTALSTAEDTALATEATEVAAVVDSSAGAKCLSVQEFVETKLTISDGLLSSVVGGSGDLVELVGAVNASGEGRSSESKDEGRGAHDDELCWLSVLN
jgi:hypothetical protein